MKKSIFSGKNKKVEVLYWPRFLSVLEVNEGCAEKAGGEKPSEGAAMRRCRCKCRKWLFAQPLLPSAIVIFCGAGCATCIKQSDASQSENK